MMAATSPLLARSVYASLRVVRVKGVFFAESSRRGAKSIAKKSWAECLYVDHLGKIDNRRLRRVDARYQVPIPIRHADDCFRWSKEIAG